MLLSLSTSNFPLSTFHVPLSTLYFPFARSHSLRAAPLPAPAVLIVQILFVLPLPARGFTPCALAIFDIAGAQREVTQKPCNESRGVQNVFISGTAQCARAYDTRARIIRERIMRARIVRARIIRARASYARAYYIRARVQYARGRRGVTLYCDFLSWPERCLTASLGVTLYWDFLSWPERCLTATCMNTFVFI